MVRKGEPVSTTPRHVVSPMAYRTTYVPPSRVIGRRSASATRPGSVDGASASTSCAGSDAASAGGDGLAGIDGDASAGDDRARRSATDARSDRRVPSGVPSGVPSSSARSSSRASPLAEMAGMLISRVQPRAPRA